MHTIQLSGPVGDQHFNIRLLDDLPPGPLKVVIDSGGGCLVSALAIFHSLREHDGEITTEIHRASSAAAIPALAGDIRLIHRSGYFFVHGCWGAVVGREVDKREAAAQFREQTRVYDSIIAERTGLTLRRVRTLTRNETRISSATAIRLKFAHSVIGKTGPCPPSPSLEKTALAALQHEKRSDQPAMRELYKEARPVAMLAPGAAPVLDRPAVPLPPIPDGGHGKALEQWAEAEQRESVIRHGLTSRLQRVISNGGRISWPLRVSWRCGCCKCENFHPPAKNKLATPCAFCAQTTKEPL